MSQSKISKEMDIFFLNLYSSKPDIHRFCEQFEKTSNELHQATEKGHNEFAQIPLISTIFNWSKIIIKDNPLGNRYFERMSEMIALKLVPTTQDNDLYLLEHYSRYGHEVIINQIRSYADWYQQKREDAIIVYLSFADWLSQATHGYIKQAIDPDRTASANKILPYEKYVNLLALLPDRERLITKLFYLGGPRSLDDILSLQIQDINFSQYAINFQNGSKSYPQHVFTDIKAFMGNRKRGFLFSNKQLNEQIHHTVPYRTLKKAAIKAGFPENFSYKDLVKEN